MHPSARRRKLFVFLLLAALGAARDVGAGDCPFPGGGAISGRVTVAAGGAALVGTELVLERIIDGSLITIAGTASGPTGHYQFAGLFAGDYFVRTQGNDLLVDEVWPDTACDQVCNPQEVGTAVAVAVGGSVEEIDFTLAAGGRIEGVVYLADGITPVPGASVEGYVLGPFGAGGLLPVVAGVDGAWSIDGLETGIYKVRAFAPGLLAELFPDTLCAIFCDVFALGSPIAVTAGATTAGIDVALGPGASISGTITDLALAPLPGIAVMVRASAGVGSVRALTDANGAWSTPEGLPPGTYSARTGSEHRDELWDDLPCEPFCALTGGTPIVVGAVPVGGIDFALERLGAISGTIVDSGTGLPLANVTVAAQPSASPFASSASTASDGTYRIAGLVADSYRLTAQDGFHVGEIYDNAGACHDPGSCQPSSPPTLVDVVGAGETTAIDFELDPGGVLAGAVVVAATNAPVFGATVVVVRLDGGPGALVYTDGSGRFRISGLPAGVSYQIVANPSSSELLSEVWQEQSCVQGSCQIDTGTPVPVGLAAPACVSFTLNGVPKAAGIAGQVTGEGGPLGGIQIHFFDESGAFAGAVQSDAAGAYLTTGALALPAGNYFALAQGNATYVGELYDGLPCDACDPTTGTPVVVTEGSTTGGIDFDLELVGVPPPPLLPLIFLEDCKPAGCVYFLGFEDSRFNRSSIILSAATADLDPFALPSDFWDDLVACVRQSFRPFAVEVTDVDPGAVPHLEHVVAGSPLDLGFPVGILGVSPFNCGFISNSISFTFAEAHGTVPSPELLDELCWTAVHEISHQHGLDHHFYVPDALTYMPGCGPKLLPARDVPCGEFSQVACVCGGSAENSYDRIRAVHGASDLVFGDGFEVVESGENCAWSAEVPPPLPFAPLAAPDARTAPRCGALEPSNPGFHPRPRSPR